LIFSWIKVAGDIPLFRVRPPRLRDFFRRYGHYASRMTGNDTAPWLGASARFATTQWTVVLFAGRDGPGRAAALEKFCRAYWYPLYAFIRRRGGGPDEARDLTQEFFARLIEGDWLAGIERRDTRFSTLLLTMLKRFLVNEHERSHTAKRGGGIPPVSIDVAQAEAWFGAEPATDETPEKTFERRWALAVLESALSHLRMELVDAGKSKHFEMLSPFLSREPDAGDYEIAGAALGLAARTIAVAVHRLRQRYRAVLREELAAGSPDSSRVDEEMRHLARALEGRRVTLADRY
jgi:DNA-directed RNA polymerase specialized sigma24 family protein